MPAVRVTVVSDSHLSARTPEAAVNWDTVVDHVAATSPDLVVHAGDISADGAGRAEDLDLAAAQLERLPAPTMVVPGNHDIGDSPGLTPEPVGPGDHVVGHEHVLDGERLARFRHVFGADRFSVRLGAWRIVGVDSQLLGSGLPAEEEQWEWLATELDGAAGWSPVAFVLHMPVLPAGADGDHAYRYVAPAARARLLALLDAARARLVVSGHVHQRLRHDRGGATHVWAPTTWAVLPEDIQPSVGEKACGVVELTLHDDGRADAAAVAPPGMRNHTIGVDAANPY